MRWHRVVALLSLAAACSEEVPRRRTVESAMPCEDYALYRLAIDSIVTPGMESSPLIVISPTMGGNTKRAPALLREDPTVPDDIRAAFMVRNQIPCALDVDSLSLGTPVTVLSADSVLALEARAHPDSAVRMTILRSLRNVVRLSRVGYNRDSSQAVVYVDHRCGGLCGTGWTVHLRRDPVRGWRVTKADTRWIA